MITCCVLTMFKKGNIPWHTRTKGLKPAPKTAFKKGFTPWNKNKKGCFSEETINKMRNSHKGQKPIHAGGELPQLQWDKHHKFKDGRSAYQKQVKRWGIKPVCKVCGKAGEFTLGSIEIHHIDKNRKNNTQENLMPLCVLHHKRVDRGLIPCPSH